jgi:hypothetical protein
MKPTLTLSFACAVATSAPTKSALAKKRLSCLTILDIGSSRTDLSLTYPRSNFYESVVPHPELNEFAKQLGHRVNNPMVARLTLRVTHRDLDRRAATAVGGQHRSGHERRLIGGEEDLASGDFRRLRHAKAASVITVLWRRFENVALRGIAVYG